MNKTNIIFAELIWNPVTGCKHISQLCDNCWADIMAENKRGLKAFPNGFDLTFWENRLNQPSKTRENSLVFVGPQTDLFLHKIPDAYRDKIFDEIESNPQHEFMIFTKRPGKMLKYSMRRKFPKNAWAIISIGLEAELKMIDILRKIDVEIRGLSIEPLLEKLPPLDLTGISLSIVGGESGSHLWNPNIRKARALVEYDKPKKLWYARPDRVDWIRDLRDNCRAFGTSFFFKQWGGAYPECAGRKLDGKFYSEMPRYPKGKTEINNKLLKTIEGRI